jgi:hypothetical protein
LTENRQRPKSECNRQPNKYVLTLKFHNLQIVPFSFGIIANESV